MRLSTVLAALAAAALALPAPARAKSWQGINPGTSGSQEVVEKLGEPTTRTKRATRTILAYLGEQAPRGTKQAQFHVGEDGIVQEITVFLATQIDRETIESTYGKPSEKTFTDEFLPVWVYRQAGVVVFFDGSSMVTAISFTPGKSGAPKPAEAAAPPAGAAPAAAAPAAAR